MRRAVGTIAALLAGLAASRVAYADGALEAVAAQGARGVGAPPPAAIVISAPIASDVPVVRGPQLAEKIVQLVAGALGNAARAHGETASLPQARVIAAKARSLVFVEPVIEKGTLRVTLDVYPVVSNGWDRVRDPAPPPRAHAFASAPIDAELRAYLASISLEHASVHRATLDEEGVLAAACGDLDEDGGMEIALVTPARVSLGRVAGGKLVLAKSVPWTQLSSRAPFPLRESIGGASIVKDGARAALFAGTTDRGAVVLDASLALVGAARGIPIAASEDACAAADAASNALGGNPFACAGDGKAPPAARFLAPAPHYDALAAFDVVRPDGSTRAAVAAREPNGKLDVRFGDATHTIDDAGAQVAVGDLDQDGVPEIIASSGEGADAITVWSWDGTSDPRERLHLPAPGGVRALAVCPPEEGGAPALVAVVGGEVWIVR